MKQNRQMRRILIITGLAMILAAMAIFFGLNRSTSDEQVFSFSSTYNDRDVILQASLWETDDAEYAVLICPGYSCDRQKWRPFADLFVSNGFTTMVFDYAGQGASSGTIGFDNAKTDAIPAEIDDALEELHIRTGIPFDHILLAGHSMGGRAILRLLYDYNCADAETKAEPKSICAAILLSPEVNYSYNAQASLFAGTSDDVDEPWASYSAQNIAGTDVYLYGSTADDIVNDKNILAIYSHLGGENLPEQGRYTDIQVNSVGSQITVGITGGILHSYEMYSPEFATFVNEALSDITGRDMTYASWHMALIYVGWVLALAGISLFLAGLNSSSYSAVTVNAEKLPILENPAKFLCRKLLLWIPGLTAAFLICCFCVALPFGSPVMNLPYMCCIAGYGLVTLLCYHKGNFPGISGKLPALFRKTETQAKNLSVHTLLFCLMVSIAVCFAVWYVLRASMYRLIPLNTRLFWVLFAGALMTVGYYISGVERDMLTAACTPIRIRVLYNLIQYVALFLLVLFYLVIKSYSGLIGQAQNMILMYVFCVPLGDFIRNQTGSRFVGAFVTGFLFQTLMITSAALIAIF